MQKTSRRRTRLGPRWWARIALIIAAALTVAALLAVRTSNQQPPIALVGGQAFALEVAYTAPERERGLSGHEYLRHNEAMLFVFQESDKHCFWMKDMNFPIDMVWLDEKRKVISIAHSVEPESYPAAYCPESPARYVLEYQAGLSDALELRAGDEVFLRYQSVNQ